MHRLTQVPLTYKEALTMDNPTASFNNRPKYITTRTITVTSRHSDAWKVEHLIEDLRLMNMLDSIEAIQSTPLRGEFNITYNREREREEAEETFRVSDTGFVLVESQLESQTMVLTGIPVEYSRRALHENIAKYVKNPDIEEVYMQDTHIKTGNIKVKHEGMKRPIGRKLYVGPNIGAFVKETSHIAMGQIDLKCVNCLQQGHLQWNCKREKKCFRCRGEGHVGRECERCKICLRWGHGEMECEVGVSTQIERGEEGEKEREDRIEKGVETRSSEDEKEDDEENENGDRGDTQEMEGDKDEEAEEEDEGEKDKEEKIEKDEEREENSWNSIDGDLVIAENEEGMNEEWKTVTTSKRKIDDRSPDQTTTNNPKKTQLTQRPHKTPRTRTLTGIHTNIPDKIARIKQTFERSSNKPK